MDDDMKIEKPQKEHLWLQQLLGDWTFESEMDMAPGQPKTYASGFQALKNVDLEIRRGEIFALLGPQRRRQDHADQHRLRHRQCRAPAGHGRRPRHRRRLPRGALADRPGAAGADHRRLRDRLEHGLLQPRPVRQAAESAHIEKVLKDLSLWDKKDNKIRTLSGGMKRRVLIAKALSHEPQLLFLDEPTAGVDVELRQDMWKLVRAARNRRHHHPDHPLHRRGRGDGRPHRRHQQGRDHPGRRQGRADAQAGQEAADAAAAGSRWPQLPEALAGLRPGSCPAGGNELVYTYDAQGRATGIARCCRTWAAGIDFKDLRHEPELARGHLRQPGDRTGARAHELHAIRAIYRSRWRAPGARCCKASSRRSSRPRCTSWCSARRSARASPRSAASATAPSSCRAWSCCRC
jgi:ABC-2 type transport system ATP-binding protein